MASSDIERELGRLSTLAERAERDRTEILSRISGVESQLATLNSRTKKLEGDNERSQMVWKQVADMSQPVKELGDQVTAMREPFQLVSSAVRLYQVWRWRFVFIVLLAFSAGNQAFRVVFDFVIHQIAVAWGIS